MLVTLGFRYTGFEDLVLLDYTLATLLQGLRGLCLARLHVVMLDYSCSALDYHGP